MFEPPALYSVDDPVKALSSPSNAFSFFALSPLMKVSLNKACAALIF